MERPQPDKYPDKHRHNAITGDSGGTAGAGPSLFRPGHNCWRTDRVRHGALLVDCANYYRALAGAIANARHSIFIIGWDIDSRIRLLRGEDEARFGLPSVAADLLAWKAEQNPDLDIYLLRWDSSFVFAQKREWLAKLTWQAKTPPNVHICLDDTDPATASHHQKIVVIDDEIAFTGGMDIATGRWDERDHKPHNPERTDPVGPYGPYHDIQLMISGPMVRDFAELARDRWHHAARTKARPIRKTETRLSPELPPAWPQDCAPGFHDIGGAIARTLPPGFMKEGPVNEVEMMYLDLIETAEDFLYIENQFLSRENIADALNQRLREVPGLRVLIVSSFNPQGVFEREALWAARIRFRDIVCRDIDCNRVRIVYPVSRSEQGDADNTVRIHSKIMVVDDRYFTVASSNLNNRSMGLDTECDLTLEASSEEHRQQIREHRNDLISEHAGLDAARVDRLVRDGAPLSAFVETGRLRFLRDIKDEQFTKGSYREAARAFADPGHPLMRPVSFLKKRAPSHGASALSVLAVIVALLVMSVLWAVAPGLADFNVSRLVAFFSDIEGLRYSVPVVLGLFVAAAFIAFPLTLLILATAAAFGTIQGGVLAITGALLSAAAMFGVARLGREHLLQRMLGPRRVDRVAHKIRDYGLFGIVLVRMIPAAPYSIVNLAIGLSGARFGAYIVGTALGILPVTVAMSILGEALIVMLRDPTPQMLLYICAALTLWIGAVAGALYTVRRMQKTGGPETPGTGTG